MNIVDRMRILKTIEKLSYEKLSNMTGIDKRRIENIFSGTEIRANEIEMIGKTFPDYKHWIAFGEEIPEAGQISPMTRATQQNLNQ